MAEVSGFRPVGEPIVTHKNPWFQTEAQPMDFINPTTGAVKLSAADGGCMNYVRNGKPGSLVVAVSRDEQSVYLVRQERYLVNLVLGGVNKHWELPGGGLDDDSQEPPTAEDYLRGARAELTQEALLTTDDDDFFIVGPATGQFPHPQSTDRNACVVVRNVRYADGSVDRDHSEAISSRRFFTWRETRQMYLGGLAIEGGEPLIISSEPTIAKLNMAQQWLEMQAEKAMHRPTVIDLAPGS